MRDGGRPGARSDCRRYMVMERRAFATARTGGTLVPPSTGYGTFTDSRRSAGAFTAAVRSSLSQANF
jgi:hypothetical protein